MGGGAWPFLVGGVICLLNCDNERDSGLLNRRQIFYRFVGCFLEGRAAFSRTRMSNNRSVMPLDVLGRTRATLIRSSSLQPWLRGLGNLFKPYRAGDRLL